MTTTYTIRPSTDEGISAGISGVGAGATIAARMADDADGTYADYPDNSTPFQRHFLTNPSIGADELIRQVRARVRLLTNAGTGQVGSYLDIYQGAVGEHPWHSAFFYNPNPHGALDLVGGWFTLAPDGDPWTPTKVNDLQILYSELSSSATGNNVAELYVDIETNDAPTATISAPTSGQTITYSNKPTITFAYADAESDAMERYRVVVFTAAQVAAPGFDPETSTPTWDSGWVLSTLAAGASLNVQVNDALTNGVTYHAYVYVSDTGSGGLYYAPNGDSVDFTIQVDKPVVPGFTAVTDTDRMLLSLTGKDNLLTQTQADIESTPVTSAWAAKTNAQAPVQYTSITPAQGVGALRILATAAGDVVVDTSPTKADVVAGMVINAGMKIRRGVSAVGKTMAIGLRFETSAGVLVGSETYGTGVASTTTWQSVTHSETVPATATKVVVLAKVTSAGGASEDQLIDEIYVRPNSATGWSRGGFVPSQGVEIQRSYDAGATWEDVRWAGPDDPLALGTDQLGTLYDYETLPEETVTYRARVVATTTEGGDISSDWTSNVTVSGTISRPDTARIISPSTSADDDATRMDLCQLRHQDSKVPLSGELVYALERTNPIARRGIRRGRIYEFDFLLEDDAEWEAFQELLDELAVFWISPFGETVQAEWIAWFGEVSVRDLTSNDMRLNQHRLVSVSGAVVDAP